MPDSAIWVLMAFLFIVCRCSLALAGLSAATIPEQIQKINHPREIDSNAIDTANPIEKYILTFPGLNRLNRWEQ